MQRTQGTPTKQKFDVDSSQFTFQFKVSTKITAPSIGYFSQDFYYENGLSYTLTDKDEQELPEDAYTAEYKDNLLTFLITDDSYNGQIITLKVTKK